MNAARRSTFSAAAVTVACAAALGLGLAAPAAAAPARAASTAVSTSTSTAAASTVSYATWLADATAATAPAQAYLQQRVAAVSSTKGLAIVLDIDNTSLASYFSSGYPVPATPPVLALAQYATAHGVKVFFVTGRPDLIDAATEYNLTSVGYTVDGLYSRNVLQLLESLQTFKTAARKQIEANGYDIVANVGNSASDLAGGYADATFKLPDYDGLLD
ncbi:MULTISPECIES: HAD family acid phosphatase [Streptacidiphilus]|uniref:HAD family acid phosphatase n=1 Tax=Streptacidiphilus cavernicola TaxID=3342716 RepID=A0ABV6UGV7_9ACTN|nr:HAD family acid phosphatase [Streptacidiphilus jeojiense]